MKALPNLRYRQISLVKGGGVTATSPPARFARCMPSLVFVLAIGLLFAGSAQGQSRPERGQQSESTTQESTEEARARARKAAFRAYLDNPGDATLALRYAELAAAAGDLEAAVGVLSSLLITHPEMWQPRLELGVLYFRLGSYALAQSYFQSLAGITTTPDSAQPRITDFMRRIEARLARHQWSGRLLTGLRYRTNVNIVPRSVPRGVATESATQDQFSRKAVFDLMVGGTVRHNFDFNTADRSVLASELRLFGSKQAEGNELDLISAEISSGPKFHLPSVMLDDATVQPILLAGYSRLETSEFFRSFGAGVEFVKGFGDTARLVAGYRMRAWRFQNTTRRPSLSDLDGLNHTLEVNADIAFAPDLVVGAGLRTVRSNAAARHEANDLVGVEASVTKSYDAPFGLTEGAWVSGLSSDLSHSWYDAPYPTSAGPRTRKELRWLTRILTRAPLSESLLIFASGGYFRNDSKLAVFSHDSFDVLVGIEYIF